jgi:DNA-directed RNA polymerase specialized sigma24 family protein
MSKTRRTAIRNARVGDRALMHEVHAVALKEVALALGIAPTDAQNLLARARRRIRAADKPSVRGSDQGR